MADILLENIILRLIDGDKTLLISDRSVDRGTADRDARLTVVDRDAHLEITLSIVDSCAS